MTLMTKTAVWTQLKQHFKKVHDVRMCDLFKQQPDRFDQFNVKAAGLTLDYSKNRITVDTMRLLMKLAHEQQLPQAIEGLVQGKVVNHSEQRSAQHMSLRNISNSSELLKQSLAQMRQLVGRIREGGVIRTVIHIGVGGSLLGPRMTLKALKQSIDTPINFHFISHFDKSVLQNLLLRLDPESTLFVIASKSFGTAETLFNAKIAKQWAGNRNLQNNFIAVTAESERALAFGISKQNILNMWQSVGGRFSVWSAVGVTVAMAVGWNNFIEFLKGAELMDLHFKEADFHSNMPVIMGLLGVWYTNFFNAQTQAIIPYSYPLMLLPNYFKQLHMESLGKNISQQGEPLDYATGPIVWGGIGGNSQHSFHQLLMQGSHLVPVDFILPLKSNGDVSRELIANCLAQAETLMRGYQSENSYKSIPGNSPSNLILMPSLTPRTLGSLLALYEHKVFVQAVIWDINPFDQWGVERGKVLANTMLSQSALGESDLERYVVEMLADVNREVVL